MNTEIGVLKLKARIRHDYKLQVHAITSTPRLTGFPLGHQGACLCAAVI